MKKPLISICIPTWNRWYSLQHTLKSIVEQDEFASWDVEIIISDNASTDETENEIKKLCVNWTNIKYYKNKNNIWAMQNINKSYSLWTWKYLRCLSSHTKVNHLSLKRIFELLTEFEPVLLMNLLWKINFSFYENRYFLKNYNMYLFDNMVHYFNYLWDQYVYDKKSFSITNNLFSNVWSLIIKKSYYDKAKCDIIIDKWNQFFNYNNFIHLFTAYYNGWKKRVLLNIVPAFSGVSIDINDEAKEIMTQRNRKEKIYKKDAHNFTKYIRNKYYCSNNFLSFLKKFDCFWTKLYLVNNVPFIDLLKKFFNKELRAKIWNFIGNR